MEPSVSGNDISYGDDDQETGRNENPSEHDNENEKPAETESSREPVTNNYTYETYETYEIDNSKVCELLNQLFSETEKNNEVLGRLADSLDEIKESLTEEPEETEAEDFLPDEQDETETGRDELLELLEGMEETFAGIKESGESINKTVSGNALLLKDLNNTTEAIAESYAESFEKQTYTSTYDIAVSIAILFAACCIAGLNIAKLVWGKMR